MFEYMNYYIIIIYLRTYSPTNSMHSTEIIIKVLDLHVRYCLLYHFPEVEIHIYFTTSGPLVNNNG